MNRREALATLSAARPPKPGKPRRRRGWTRSARTCCGWCQRPRPYSGSTRATTPRCARSSGTVRWPGEVGHIEINRLRARAQAALGPKYELRAFDDTVVLGGNVPLDVLATNVHEYIASAKAR
jgi:hypothetical protein